MKSNSRTFTSIFLAICLVFSVFLLFLPFLCNTYLVPRLLKGLPFSQKELSLSKITPWQLQGSLRLVQNGEPVIAVPNFEIHYSLSNIINGTIDSLLLDSPSLQLTYDGTTLSVAGAAPNTGAATRIHGSPSFTLPAAIKKVILRNAHLAIQTPTGKQDIILDTTLHCGFANHEQAKHRLTTLDADINTTGAIHLVSMIKGVFSSQGVLFSVNARVPDLLDLTALALTDKDQQLSGELTLTGQVALTPELEIAHLKADAEVRQFQGSLGSFVMASHPSGEPANISIEGDKKTLTYQSSGLSLIQPEQLKFKASGTINLQNQEITGTATLDSKRLDQPVTVEATITRLPEAINSKVHVNSAPLTVDNTFKLGLIDINTDISYDTKNLTAQINGNLQQLTLPEQQLSLKNLRWKLPFQVNIQKKQIQNNGTLTIDTISYKDVDTAGFATNVSQSPVGFDFTSSLISKIASPGQIDCSGSALFAGSASVACTFKPTLIDTAQLPEYIKIPENIHFIGTIAADGNFTLSPDEQKGLLKVSIKDSTFTSGGLEAKGIATDVVFPDLPSVRSLPNQKATIATISSGQIQLSDGRINYRIEDTNSLFLEKVRLSWCGGKLESGSLSLNAETKEIDTTIYCDRLGFVELLRQFGIEDTEGQGSLNGRLPVAISRTGIRFDDGFLFSTPGNSGIVRFNNTKQLRQGMPDLGQTASLDYSIKALENFAYNWTKLSFNTEGDNLLLTMQLDGKPAAPLPFGYKNGQIVATEKGQGIQHPIQLDMNFRLPLQEIFQYGTNLQSFMEKM
jgi:hypothetical protein